ncbi:hypothetical protein [Halapricum hydrolyticum]|uniref:DNA primase/polymerase bifunctional N-terminal domain-containing protein n=1 Tax=Halapricum hydrolyticum TaxID=2979991 RepID=A0AAE3LFL1_9EURY|nr:hypothetical protein [Halapricum hydrolyticum]MCU4718977.1 hypothetical protein [Halapricum hydrolyticum]MCU4727906.1 hypothetical protein [Halapricum hydrolyticum]
MTLKIVEGAYPFVLTGFESWVTWEYIDGRKQPFSPWSDAENEYSWSDPENFTDYETAKKWGDMHPELEGVGFVVQRQGDAYQEPADPVFLVDLDDVVDTETGEVHPFALMLVDRMDSYADLSVSGSGIHIYGVGELPDGVKTIQDDLPAHPDFPNAEIEVYDGKRFTAVTGTWLNRSNREVTECDYWIRRLSRRFTTTTPTNNTPIETPDIDNSEFDDVETTDDIDELSKAIQSVGESDLRLKSTETRERDSGVIDYDPAYRKSESGTGLAWLPDNEIWMDRDGEHYMDALALVAVEERIITSPSDYPSGEDYWKAVQRLRERGASIPRYEEKPADLHGLYAKAESDDEEREQFLKALQV